jgi:hypothetical protein
MVPRSGVPITVAPLDASNFVPITTFFTAAVGLRRVRPRSGASGAR